MLTPETEIFISRPEELASRTLHPCTLTAVQRPFLTLELAEQQMSLDVGDDLFVFFEIRNEFVKQPGRVTAVMESDAPPTVAVELSGEPASAEARQCFRVSTRCLDLAATLDVEANCPLVDISNTGLAVIAETEHQIGAVLPVALAFRGTVYVGDCCIQSVLPMRNGRFRYGLHCVDRRVSPSCLKRGLQTITMEIQRLQLRRRSGQQ